MRVGSPARVKPAPEFLGPLTRNNALDYAERMFEGKIGFGPESLAIQDGYLYTGVSDGRILRIKNNKAEQVIKMGTPGCVSYYETSDERKRCGYPLGMRFDKNGDLIVADGVKGLYRVNVKTKAINFLAPRGAKSDDGSEVYFANDVDLGKNGDIYFTDVTQSPEGASPYWMLLIAPRPKGRIFHYDPTTKKLHTVIDAVYYPNGIQLSPNEDFLIFSQHILHNVMKYHLKGPKQGQLEVFMDNLPGLPDNIRPSGRGTYWIGLYTPRVPDEPSLWERLDCCSHFQIGQLFVYGFLELVVSAFDAVKYVAKFYQPFPILDEMQNEVRNFITNSVHHGDYGLIVEFNMNGEILRTLHSPHGIVNKVSQATEHEGTLYITSPVNNFIGKYKLK